MAKRVDILLSINAKLDQVMAAQREVKELERGFTSFGNLFRSGGIMSLGAMGTNILTQAIVDGTKKVIDYKSSIETSTLAFKTLLGSMDAAKQRIKEVEDISAKTPFEFTEVVQANRLLQTLTDGALATREGMLLVGDAAAASGTSFEETSMWIGRLYSGLKNGQPVGEATLRLLELGLITGETKTELETLAKQGTDADGAWAALQQTFGKTNGAMDDMSRSFKGLTSTMKDWATQSVANAAVVEGAWITLNTALENFLVNQGVLVDRDTAKLKKMAAAQREVAELIRESASSGKISESEASSAMASLMNRQDMESILKLRDFIQSSFGRDAATDAAAKSGPSMEEIKGEMEVLNKQIRNRLSLRKQEQALITADFRLTKVEKRQAEIDSLKNQVAIYDELIDRLRQMQFLQSDPAAAAVIGTQIEKVQSDRDTASGNLASREAQADPFSFAQQIQAEFVNLQDSWGTLAQNMAQTLSSTVGSTVDALSSGLANAIVVTGNFKDALASIPQMIGVQIVQSIIRMGLQWVSTQIMMMVAGRSMMAAAVATSAPMAAASAAIWAAPATLASIASGGSLPAAAPGMISASIGLTKGLALTGFMEGGFTGAGPMSQVAGVVHRGEFVMPASTVSQFGVGFMEAIKDGQAPNVNVGSPSVKVVNVYDKTHLRQELMGSLGEEAFLNHFNRHRGALGIA